MLSRALSLATVMLLIGFAAVPAQAQNLEAGKSPSQIFAGGCAVCHKSPRGLLKTVAPGQLPAFLRQHYTTSTDMAASMAAYVVSNGAPATSAGGRQARCRCCTSSGRARHAPGPQCPATGAPGDRQSRSEARCGQARRRTVAGCHRSRASRAEAKAWQEGTPPSGRAAEGRTCEGRAQGRTQD
jgi:hypothetical protein